jgi:creatinase
MERPDFFELKNGEKVKLPFTKNEYDKRLNNLRSIMENNNLDMVIITSMHNIAYYTGFIYCSFGRPYGCVVTKKKFLQFQQILMQANLGEDHIVII